MKILCIGHAAYDITVPMDNYPLENTKNRITERIECGGGPSCTAAYLLGYWNMETYFAGIIGNDIYGNKILDELKSVGVNTKFLEINNHYNTSSSFIIINKENGSRTIFSHHPNNIKMSNLKLDFEPDIILIDGKEEDISIRLIEQYPNAITVMDADKIELIEIAKKVKYLVCSKDFAEKVTNLKFAENYSNAVIIYKKMEEKFNNNIVITLERDGCLYKLGEKIKIMPSIKVKQVDSTGAGDIFHGAFVYGLANNYDFEVTLRLANIAGALSVTKMGSRNSIPLLEEVKKVYHESR